jgi:hypothetical protein
VVRGEFLIGAHAAADAIVRQRGLQFYSERIAGLPSFASEPADYAKAAALAGDARRTGQGKPGLIDGSIASHWSDGGHAEYEGLRRDGLPCANPLEASSRQPSH